MKKLYAICQKITATPQNKKGKHEVANVIMFFKMLLKMQIQQITEDTKQM